MNDISLSTSLNVSANQLYSKQFGLAVKDWLDAVRMWKLWTFLAWNDIKMRYRGSVLGPFWITASMAIFITAFSMVYSRIFHQALNEYVPFLTCGYLIWMLISSVLAESCNTYIEASFLITEIKLPYVMYVLRLVTRHLWIFFHNIIVYFIVAIIFGVSIHWSFLYIIPGLFLIIANLISVGLFLSILGVKYRDIPQVITSIIQVAFFITPVTWDANLLQKSLIVMFNPFNYFINIVRLPMLGQSPGFEEWFVALSITIVTFIISFLIFTRYRKNIPFWI